MTRLIFDIETVGVDFDSLDDTSKDYLLAYAESEDEAQQVKDGLGFSPLTGQVVAIGVLNPDTDKGAVYYISEKTDKHEEGSVSYIPVLSERELLIQFWDMLRFYDQIITFNGRAFDGPFLMTRSAVNHIKPSKNLMPNRYYDAHIDLCDRLSFFGAVRRKGTSLHMWCQAFGIKSPKDDGITGADVTRLFREGRYEDIARYCAGDLGATKELFFAWEKYINIK